MDFKKAKFNCIFYQSSFQKYSDFNGLLDGVSFSFNVSLDCCLFLMF